MRPQLKISVPYIHFVPVKELTGYLNDMRIKYGRYKCKVRDIRGAMTTDEVKKKLVIFWVRRQNKKEFKVFTNIYVKMN